MSDPDLRLVRQKQQGRLKPTKEDRRDWGREQDEMQGDAKLQKLRNQPKPKRPD